MSDDEFMSLVDAALGALPTKVRDLMVNVAIVVDEEISDGKMKEMGFEEGEIIFGLYEGMPQTERGVDYQSLPDKITIFKRPILTTYSDLNDIKECIENTVWHEVAHHFGYGDPWIEREEERRGREK